ncbi:GGDEF domain-containing protein [Alginatibacterium sediminis]|uniref:diguanylate cyclase n=1 Tax=Alginatibacterium sediminis TaxID=2164068 RepID=A0A420E9U3_9ALTE|nr:GGDEF domain-containing protein [Alginatibacterium sediminis]RKF17441.1 GGDEF domain-containing protein [Alginatibacterium sediminis]
MHKELDIANYQQSLASITQHQSQRILFYVGLLYLALAIFHFLLIPDPVIRQSMTLIALFSALYIEILVVIARKVEQDISILMQISTAFVITLNSFAHIYLTGDIHQTTNLLITIMALGGIGAHKNVFYVSMLVTSILWVLLINTLPSPTHDIVHFSFAVAISVFASIMIFRHRFTILGQLLVQKRQTEFIATFDPMTHCLRRHAFDHKAQQLVVKCGNRPFNLGLMYCDLDYFKRLNDSAGHAQGDLALERSGQLIAQFANQHGLIAGRTGGEEFSIVGEISSRDCRKLANQLVKTISDANIPHPDSPVSHNLTISIGFVCLDQSSFSNLDQMSQLADKALYKAKDKGRDQSQEYLLNSATQAQNIHQ